MNETTGTDRDKPTRADIGRVYLHGTTVPVVLINDREVSMNPNDFMVIVKRKVMVNGEYLVLPVDCRNLIATDEWVTHPHMSDNSTQTGSAEADEEWATGGSVVKRNVVLIVSADQAALLHSIVRESGWGYTESGVPEVATEILELAGEIRKCREASGTDKVVPTRYNSLFDAQFAGVSDHQMITGESGPQVIR